ncbi:hypothetical protein ACFX13_013641 [Malus domestica]
MELRRPGTEMRNMVRKREELEGGQVLRWKMGREAAELENLGSSRGGKDEGVEFVVHAGSLGLEVNEGTTRADPPFSL